MLGGRKLVLVVACAGLALPSAAFAQGAGDDQYVDPLAGLTGPEETKTQSEKSKPKKSGGASTSQPSSTTVTTAPVTATATSSADRSKRKPSAAAQTPKSRAAIDINGLSGIGSLVAVPVKHVTLVLGDIAHERS
jgi:hypothetical protein